MEMLESDHFFFIMFCRVGLCASLKFLFFVFFFQATGVAGFGGLNLFLFILSEITVNL
jgi:hypothetical protein